MIPPSAVLIFFALAGLAGILGSWSWIIALQDSAAAFVGSMAGGAIGLLAILAGAMYNAHLNRKIAKELRTIERHALLEALLAELELFGNILLAHAGRAANLQESLRGEPHSALARARESLIFPQPKIYETNLARLGLIGGRLTSTLAHAYADAADTGVFIANIPDERIRDALSDIGRKCLSNRETIVAAHRVLMAEIEAMGGLTDTHVSDETVAASTPEAKAEIASDKEPHADTPDKSTRAEQRGAGLAP